MNEEFSGSDFTGMITRFLHVQPSDLKFPFVLNKPTTCSIKLVNNTHLDVAFKVKTTHPKKYCVFPIMGLISPGCTCVVEVSMQAQKVAPVGASKKDKFLIQSVVAENEDKLRGVTSDMFMKAMANELQEYKLRVVFVSANPPSPIPEASEEGSSSEAYGLENYDPLSCRNSIHTNDSEIARISRDRRLEEWVIISKLMEERSNALVQNQKLHSELEILRKQPIQCRDRRVSLFWLMMIVSVISLVMGYSLG